MNSKEFFMRVVAMRIAQQQLKADPNNDTWKSAASKHEGIIDNEIKRVQKILSETKKK